MVYIFGSTPKGAKFGSFVAISFGREELRRVMELDLSPKLVSIGYKEW